VSEGLIMLRTPTVYSDLSGPYTPL
jgi:hypothetical protein